MTSLSLPDDSVLAEFRLRGRQGRRHVLEIAFGGDAPLTAYTIAGEVFERLRASGSTSAVAMHHAAQVLCAAEFSAIVDAPGQGEAIRKAPKRSTRKGGL